MKKSTLFCCVMALLSVYFIPANPGKALGQEVKEELKPYVLDGTEWEINTTLQEITGTSKISNKVGDTGVDKLIFKGNKFNSESSVNNGLSATNYTVSLNGQRTIYETMQTKELENVFWRIEVVDSTSIRGISSFQVKDKKGKTIKSGNYSFNGKLTSGVLVRQGEEKPAEAKKEEAPPVPQTSVETPVKGAVPPAAVELETAE